MKYEVTNLQCHIGIQLRKSVVTTVDKTKHDVSMEPHVAGVLIHLEDKVTLVPYGNIKQADMVEVKEDKKSK